MIDISAILSLHLSYIFKLLCQHWLEKTELCEGSIIWSIRDFILDFCLTCVPENEVEKPNSFQKGLKGGGEGKFKYRYWGHLFPTPFIECSLCLWASIWVLPHHIDHRLFAESILSAEPDWSINQASYNLGPHYLKGPLKMSHLFSLLQFNFIGDLSP